MNRVKILPVALLVLFGVAAVTLAFSDVAPGNPLQRAVYGEQCKMLGDWSPIDNNFTIFITLKNGEFIVYWRALYMSFNEKSHATVIAGGHLTAVIDTMPADISFDPQGARLMVKLSNGKLLTFYKDRG